MKYDFLEGFSGKWWVWLIAVVIGAWAALFVANYYQSWKVEAPYRAQDRELRDSLKALEKEGERITNLYKNDTYGGTTPEETLQLFITAMEEEDYELASKYFLPEQQEEQFSVFLKMKRPEFYINILKTYEQQGALFPDGTTYEIDFFKDGQQFHFERFIFNEYTKVWKLKDF
ncbi:hypothetical protein JXR01_02110 [Candidatus Kaiserbacteria bacterium]|nr:MAG: hypothetical protein JXR01_02110 [Candidatus Kaiserbacteria bacterium]